MHVDVAIFYMYFDQTISMMVSKYASVVHMVVGFEIYLIHNQFLSPVTL